MKRLSTIHLIFYIILALDLICSNVGRVDGHMAGYDASGRAMMQEVAARVIAFWSRVNRLRPPGKPVAVRPTNRPRGKPVTGNPVGGSPDPTTTENPVETFPPGYEESIFTVAAFCLSSEEMSDDAQNGLYECLNDENGAPAAFMSKFQSCVADGADSCESSAMANLQECILGVDDVEVPDYNIKCMEESLDMKNLKAIKKKYPVLFGQPSSEPKAPPSNNVNKPANKTPAKRPAKKPKNG